MQTEGRAGNGRLHSFWKEGESRGLGSPWRPFLGESPQGGADQTSGIGQGAPGDEGVGDQVPVARVHLSLREQSLKGGKRCRSFSCTDPARPRTPTGAHTGPLARATWTWRGQPCRPGDQGPSGTRGTPGPRRPRWGHLRGSGMRRLVVSAQGLMSGWPTPSPGPRAVGHPLLPRPSPRALPLSSKSLKGKRGCGGFAIWRNQKPPPRGIRAKTFTSSLFSWGSPESLFLKYQIISNFSLCFPAPSAANCKEAAWAHRGKT